MKKMLIIALMMVVATKVAAQESNQRVSVYLHPVSLITSIGTEVFPLLLYVTGEFPISGSNSIIVNPSLWLGEISDIDYFRIGSGVGIRHFPGGDSKGFYLQLMPSFHYLGIEEIKVYNVKAKSSGVFADVLGYIGHSAKYSNLSVFIDFGLGLAYASVKASATDGEDSASASLAKSGLTVDFNLGIGLPF
jgi:hypothetical protein